MAKKILHPYKTAFNRANTVYELGNLTVRWFTAGLFPATAYISQMFGQ